MYFTESALRMLDICIELKVLLKARSTYIDLTSERKYT